jgi:FAD binding domain
VRLSLARNADLLILAKHYGNDMHKFLAMTNFIGSVGSADDFPDAVIVGSGLAGLTAALNILYHGGKVIIMENEHLLGGNSKKASSGINAFSPRTEEKGDHLESFKNDTIKWAGDAAQLQLIETLVSNTRRRGSVVEGTSWCGSVFSRTTRWALPCTNASTKQWYGWSRNHLPDAKGGSGIRKD